MKRAGMSLAETIVGMLLITLILLTLSTVMAVGLRSNTQNSNVSQSINDLSVVRQTLKNAFNNATNGTQFYTYLPENGSKTQMIRFTTRNHAVPAGQEECVISYDAATKSIMMQYGNPARLVQHLGQGQVTFWNLECEDQNPSEHTMTIKQTITWQAPSAKPVTYQENFFNTGQLKIDLN